MPFTCLNFEGEQVFVIIQLPDLFSSFQSVFFSSFILYIISSERVMHTCISDHYFVGTLFFFFSSIKVGDRCQVEPGEKRGVVKFVGQAETLGPGFWIGVQYDEPLGKHDGM